jgi:hypothetical protein
MYQELRPVEDGAHEHVRKEHAHWDRPSKKSRFRIMQVRQSGTHASRSMHERRSVYWYACNYESTTGKGSGSGLTFTTRKFPSTSQAARIMSAEHEQGAQSKFKVHECTFPATLVHDLQPATKTVCGLDQRPFPHNIQNGKHTPVDCVRCVGHEQRYVSVHRPVREKINRKKIKGTGRGSAL